jgi:hypothetical protein
MLDRHEEERYNETMYDTLTQDDIRQEVCDIATFCWHEFFEDDAFAEKVDHVTETLKSEGLKVFSEIRENASCFCTLFIRAKDGTMIVLDYDIMVDGFVVREED